MCQEAKIEGNFTNHSLRATGATVFFNAGVPENLIQKRMGHKSLDALHTYERVTPFQDHAVAQILSSSTTLPGSCSCSDIVEFNHPSRIMQLLRYCRVQPPFHIILQKSRLMTCLCSLFHLQIRSFLTIFLIMSTLHELSYFAPCGIVLLQYRHL